MRNKAFTLIELLIVISIVGIISGAIVVQMNGAINAANDATKKVDLNTIKKALTIYQAETGNSLPMESGCTVGSCSNLDSALGDLLPDSFANTYTYSSNGTSYAVSSVLSSGYAYQYNSATNSFETLEPSNGVCGSSNGANLSSAPSTNLCNTGTASSVSSDPGPWTWTCAGTNGGETASCTTGEVPVAGVCGTKNGKYAASTPTGTQACTAGTISNMTGSYSWTCAGSNGGDSPSCATVAAAYTVTSFTTVGTSSWTVPSGVTSVEYLVVGGGGGGGGSNAGAAAGGGAGGLLTGTNLSVSGTVSITVGAGGSGGSSGGGHGSDGANSVIVGGTTVTAYGGGGGGGNPSMNGNTGGSGGGAYYSGTKGESYNNDAQGYDGGTGNTTSYATGGGGGGAGGAGVNGTTTVGGNGGAGVVSSITGSPVYYAGGGGGGVQFTLYVTPGIGGSGIGGNAGTGSNGNGSNGVVNTGSGGGGASNGTYAGGAGGSGVVILKYINNY